MAILIGKKPLCSTELKYFKALQGIDGRTLFDRYPPFENILNSNIGAQYSHFLAQPVQEGNKITFHGARYSDNDTPEKLSELQGEERAKYEQIKIDTLAHYNQVIESLKKSGKTTEAEFLTDAIKYVDDRFVYCYDDKVVLGIWGMQMRDNVREDITEICINRFEKKLKVRFNAGENGTLNGISKLSKRKNEIITEEEVPQVVAKEGYEFTGWDKNPNAYNVAGDTEFTAQYRKIIPPPLLPPPPPPLPKLPWYKRFWAWLCALFVGEGCLKWLLRLLLLLLLLLLFGWWLFRNCSGEGRPYTSMPTPPGYEGVLPPQKGVLPPVDGEPDIIPGNPSIIANRLNILMENEDKSIMDLAKDFKAKYPDEKYQIVYYDDVVKRMQIDVPREEREQLKQDIPTQFAPEYELFVFDESVFEGAYSPNDPAFADPDKAWYLNAIHAPQAWDITRGSDKLTIAIVDNGFNLKHPELSSKVVMPYNVWTHSTDIFPQPFDHGTHIAGTALAIANNGKGLCGIAPECAFMPIQVANARGLMTITSVLDGILYALYQGAEVVNVSLATQFTSLDQYPESVQQDLIHNHFKEEERLWREIMRIAAGHNSSIVVAAGNDNVLAGIDAMQRPELFVTVSAVDKNNRNLNKAEFSNYGPYATISAPGVGIYSSVGKDGYQTMDGTSMAAPIVTGAIALMKSLNDTLTTKQIICVLQNTGLDTQGNIGKLIQLDRALEVLNLGEAIDCTPAPSTGDVQILLSWNNYNDLDLICTDPQGETVWHKNQRVPSGGQLEIDMNREYPDSRTPIENIFWQLGGAPNGTYKVYLRYYAKHETNIDETPYTVKVKYGDKTDVYQGIIKKEDKTINICTFTFGDAGNRRSQLEQERRRLQQELDSVNDELKRIGDNK
ncbi:MAG: S8 family serine peptidase [Tannerellaceae bacterium]|jgi:subtilisin family serine protease|nr:S8 family serine peptidase [Tannerellaceae bacterium]